MSSFLTILTLAFVVGIVVYATRPRPTFVLEIKDRKVVAKCGQVPATFLRGCEAILSMYAIPDGWMKAYVSGARVSFRFSSSIPSEYHQNFRNAWHVHR